MIVTELWNGQGLGNQLHCYVATRCIAMTLGFTFGIHHPERFKGHNLFPNLYFGEPVTGGYTSVEGQTPEKLPDGITNYYREKTTLHTSGSNISGYDDDLYNLQDNTKIDGLMQGEGYYSHLKQYVYSWLKVEPIELDDNVCIINFRGGEYVGVKDFFLPPSYWFNAIGNMRKFRPDLRFEVVTDDVKTAKEFFPELKVTHDLENDYRSINSAQYLILSNSSFAFFPTWLNTNLKFCIAPRYWARHNISDGYWSLDQNYTQGWWYQDRDGRLGQEK